MLENHYRDIQDFEFTIQDGKLYMLQTRNGKRTGPAAVRIAVDMVGEGLIDKKEAVLRVDPQQLDQLLHPVLDPASKKSLAKLATGLPASPGAAVGAIVFTADDAVEASQEGSGGPGPQRDSPRRHSRHGSGQGHPDVARRHDQPRGGGLPRYGHTLRGGRGIVHRQREQEDGYGHSERQSADPEGRRLAVAGRLDRRSLRRQGEHAGCRTPPRGSWRRSWAGPTSSAAASAFAPMPISRAMPRRRASSAPRASDCAAPSTCSSPRIASSSCRL